MKTRALLLAGMLVFSAALPQTRHPHKPLFASPDFNPAVVERIDVFLPDPGDAASPIGKCITGAKEGVYNYDGGADWSLLHRGYNSHFKDYNKVGPRKTLYYTLPITLSDAMLSNPSKDWLQDLANRKYFVKSKEEPPPGRWIMIITIDALEPASPKGKGSATLSMYLYDREQATLLWHDQATDKLQGNLGESLMGKSWGEQMVCEDLTDALVMNLPRHKK
jgi:hypothetical protein